MHMGATMEEMEERWQGQGIRLQLVSDHCIVLTKRNVFVMDVVEQSERGGTVDEHAQEQRGCEEQASPVFPS